MCVSGLNQEDTPHIHLSGYIMLCTKLTEQIVEKSNFEIVFAGSERNLV